MKKRFSDILSKITNIALWIVIVVLSLCISFISYNIYDHLTPTANRQEFTEESCKDMGVCPKVGSEGVSANSIQRIKNEKGLSAVEYQNLENIMDRLIDETN